MESNVNQDPAALSLQIQTLAATVEELTRQNQEMRQRLQQEDNRSETNRDDDGDSQRKWLGTPERAHSDLLKEMRKEMGKLKNAIKEESKPKPGQNGQEDKFTLHRGNPRMPGTLKVSSTTTQAIWQTEGSFGSP